MNNTLEKNCNSLLPSIALAYAAGAIRIASYVSEKDRQTLDKIFREGDVEALWKIGGRVLWEFHYPDQRSNRYFLLNSMKKGTFEPVKGKWIRNIAFIRTKFLVVECDYPGTMTQHITALKEHIKYNNKTGELTVSSAQEIEESMTMIKCQYCGEEMTPRSNKKFCSPQCKARYHNPKYGLKNR